MKPPLIFDFQIFTSKNGAQNPFASAGLHLLVRQLQCQWGAVWRDKYEELVTFLETEDLSLGCECVSKMLGSHGQLAKEDHIIVNAIIDRRSLAALSPMALLDLSERFRILTTGFYVFRNGREFETVYDQNRNKRNLSYSQVVFFFLRLETILIVPPNEQIHEEMIHACDCFHEFDYEAWQGDLLEGFVTYFVSPDAFSEEDIARIKASQPLHIMPPSTENTLSNLSDLMCHVEVYSMAEKVSLMALPIFPGR